MKLPRASLTGIIVLALCCTTCARIRKTPFDHLYGDAWCAGVYQGYATGYDGAYDGMSMRADEAYRSLVQHGVSSLAKLQSREVPFFIELDPHVERFHLRRAVPERLTFTAGMTAEDRRVAQENFTRMRASIADDYTDVEQCGRASCRSPCRTK